MKRFLLTSFMVLATIGNASAFDYLNCQDEGGNTIRLARELDQIVYEYGPASAPDLRLERSIDEVEVTPWSGVGSNIWNSVQFENQGYFYSVFVDLERIFPDDDAAEVETEYSAGVSIAKGASEAVQSVRSCVKYQTQAEPDFVYDMMADFGKCYRLSAYDWVDAPNGECAF